VLSAFSELARRHNFLKALHFIGLRQTFQGSFGQIGHTLIRFHTYIFSRLIVVFTVVSALSAALPGCSLVDRQGPPQIEGEVGKIPGEDPLVAGLDVLQDIRRLNLEGSSPTVGRGQSVDFVLFSQDPDNDELDYRWTARRIEVDIPDATNSGGVFEISDNDTLVDLFQDSVTVTWIAPGELGEIELKVRIGDGVTGILDSQTVVVDVTQGPPVAFAGFDTSYVFSQNLAVQLNGALSTDPDGDALTYSWRQIAGPRFGIQAVSRPVVNVLPPADYAFELTVRDNGQREELHLPSAPDTVRVRVSDRSGRGG